ncbi:tetratricopeptide repeat protein, partial [Aduncisulcus paluster]
DAEAVLKEYLLKNPEDLIVTGHLARIYLEQNKFAQALDILKPEKAVDVKPDFIEAWGELAYMHELEKDYDSAEQIYTKMLEFPDVSNHIRLRLMELCLKLNNPERALQLAIEGPRSKAFLLEAAQ